MTKDAVLHLLHTNKPLAAAIRPESVGLLSWVGVYPIDATWPDGAALIRRFGVDARSKDHIYYVRRFDVDQELVAADVWLSEEDLRNRQDTLVVGDDALISRLAQLGVYIEELDLPHKSDYPI